MSNKTELLKLLEQNRGNALSGEALAQRLGISRAAVWKAMKALREAGHHIDAVPNRGYCLEVQSDVLSPEGICLYREGLARDAPIYVYDTLRSTSSRAKALALEGAPHGTLVVAEGQSEGRGRMGRSFYSPAHTGIYMSLLLRPEGPTERQLALTAAAGVAVCRVIERFTPHIAAIKWVNDVFVNGRKVSGILTEAVIDFESGMAESIVVGIGLNVTTMPDAAPEELRPVIGSLSAYGQPRCHMIAALADEVLALFARLHSRDFLPEYRERSLLLGQEVVCRGNGEVVSGIAVDVNQNGNLLVRTPHGETVTIKSGEVSVRRKEYA